MDEGVVSCGEGGTHILPPVPGGPALLAATCGHCRVPEAMGIDPDRAHLEPVGSKGHQREMQKVGGGESER